MTNQNTRTVPLRRKREGKTNYKKRIALLKGGKPRLVVRKTMKNIYAQIIEFTPKGDRVLVSASSAELEKKGWKLSRSNLPAAYLVGYLLGKKENTKKIGETVIDFGLQTTVAKSKLYAVLKGAVDAGLKISHSDEVMPDEERIKGAHIEKYAKELKSDDARFKKQFSKYIKNNINPEQATKYFEEMKNKL